MTHALIASVRDARAGIEPGEVASVDQTATALRESFLRHGVTPEPEQVIATACWLMERVRACEVAGDVTGEAADALLWLLGETALAAAS